MYTKNVPPKVEFYPGTYQQVRPLVTPDGRTHGGAFQAPGTKLQRGYWKARSFVRRYWSILLVLTVLALGYYFSL